MSIATFSFTDRCRPVVEVGVGDTRIDQGLARWDVARWDAPTSLWAGSEPSWLDVTCETNSAECTYGHAAILDRFVAGTATVLVDNSTGWADPYATTDPSALNMRPGRAIRFGVGHETFGVCWLFRGFIDAMTPTYDPVRTDVVQLSCIDALGEANRAKSVALAVPQEAQRADARIGLILDRAKWPAGKRDIAVSSVWMLESDLGGQAADLLGVIAESVGGAIFGDLEGNVVFRSRDWQAYQIGSPPDGTIGNVDPTDVCPVGWQRPFDRADIATRVILGRATDAPSAYVQHDDIPAQTLYGIEPYERTYLLTAEDAYLDQLGQRILQTRSYSTAPRVRSVALDARTSDAALDLMATVSVFTPSRYRCRLQYPEPHGLVFDDEFFATSVTHRLDPNTWTLDLNLDVAAPYARTSTARWDFAAWDNDLWGETISELLEVASALIGASS
jgi:hypothetical protein